MPSIPELLSGHVSLEVECLDRLYLNGYIGRLATSGGLVTFMREQLGKPIPSPVVLGQITEKFRAAVKALAEQEQIPIYQFNHKERKDDVANKIRQQRGVRDGVVFIGVAQEKARAFSGKKVNGPLAEALWNNYAAQGVQIRPWRETINGMPMASTDFGDVSQRIPAVSSSIAVTEPGTPGHSVQMADATMTERGQKAMIVGTKALAMTLVELLAEPEKLKRAKEYFDSH